MRISDWSSDVCSSYLLDLDVESLVAIFIQQLGIIGNKREAADIAFEANVFVSGLMIEMDSAHGLLRMNSSSSAVVEGDRKSDVEGKSVSVRVDFGGRGIITKKKRYKSEESKNI